ncbi:unnamed protein product [Owenia fusiformis]|uniref:MOB kinase activator-like 2 n=1 Tax=Owenia fusiformis TaxID=6347 RepID=A0A8S4NXI9_OWEFU|nr:unnamed protein product [Owenia fusiformis]
MDWFLGKGRRKEKDSPSPQAEETKQYLGENFVSQRSINVDLCRLSEIPEHLDTNEWLATNTISFFDHLNLLYGAISEFCTTSNCSAMSGPDNMQYLWFDEKGKKCKCAAPQYIDYVMTYIQKTINEESIFPSKYGSVFPSTFESTIKKIHKLLFHIFAHVYHAHYKELVLLSLHGHLNSVFLHFMIFNRKFSLIDQKETEILDDLVKALKNGLLPKNIVSSETTEVAGTTDNMVAAGGSENKENIENNHCIPAVHTSPPTT